MSWRTLIVGCGYLGGRVAELWRAAGHTVFALTRGRAVELRARGLHPVVGELAILPDLAALAPLDVVLFAVAPDRRAGQTPADIWPGGLANLLAALPGRPRVLFVSSTSVYGQTDGSWVTEESPAEPIEESGRLIRQAEQLLETWPGAALLRFAGIYGPQRLLRETQLRAGEPLVTDPTKWLNLIHVDDGARVIEHVAQANWSGVINVCDGVPVTRGDYYRTSAKLLGAPEPKFVPSPPSGPEANRRLRRGRLAELPLLYPSYAEGLAASIASAHS